MTHPGNALHTGISRPSPRRIAATDSPASTNSPSTARSSFDGSATLPDDGETSTRSGSVKSSRDVSTTTSQAHRERPGQLRHRLVVAGPHGSRFRRGSADEAGEHAPR